MTKRGARQMLGRAAFILLFAAFQVSWSFVPSTRIDLSLSENCRPEFLEDGILARSGSQVEIESFLHDYFRRCEFALRKRSSSTWLAAVTRHKIDYNLEERVNIRRVEFVDQRDGVMRPGLLALQRGNRARPLVIFQCGALCNLNDPSMRSIMISLYDTGVFHVLALPSSSGSEYQKINGVMSLGGLDEGRQLMRIALMLRDRSYPYASKISDIHLFGVSLGAHSALYASLYADHYESTFGRRPFDSVFVGCPVVRLQESIENITRKSVIGRVFYSSFITQIRDIFHSNSVLRDLIPDLRGFRPQYAELRNIIARGALDYYKNKTRDPSWGLNPLADLRINTIEDLWATNDYIEMGHPRKSRPLFIWNSRNDPVVEHENNTQDLLQRDFDSGQRRVFGLVTPRGHHCMFEAAYGWQTTGAVFRGYMLSQSPEFARSRQRSSLAITPDRLPENFRVRVHERRTGIYWIVDRSSKAIELRTTFRHKDCAPEGKLHNNLCFRKSTIGFSYDELGLRDHFPVNNSEREALERRLNSNYRIYGASGRYLSTREDPVRIEIMNYL